MTLAVASYTGTFTETRVYAPSNVTYGRTAHTGLVTQVAPVASQHQSAYAEMARDPETVEEGIHQRERLSRRGRGTAD